MQPDLRQMRYFVAVAEERSFTRAARRLSVAQQVLSQQMRVIEMALDAKLLDRTTRKVELTPAGVVFLGECRRLLAAAERAVTRTQQAAQGSTGVVRVAYTATVSYDTMPVILDAMSAAHPEVEVHAQEVFAGDIAAALMDQRFDVALAPRTPMPSGLTSALVRTERQVMAVGADHPLAGAPQVALTQLRRESFRFWPPSMAPGFAAATIEACRAAGFTPRRAAAGGGTLDWGAVARGDGVLLTVESNARQLHKGVELIEVSDAPAPLVHVDAVWLRELVLPAMRRFGEVAQTTAAARRWLSPPLELS